MPTSSCAAQTCRMFCWLTPAIPTPRGSASKKPTSASATNSTSARFLPFCARARAQDFTGYKKPTVLRRIERRMGLNRVTKINEYAKILRQSNSEVTALADDMLIHVTGFFRDREAWETLREQVIVPLIGSRQTDESVRCWVTACSSGEEAYSLAILLAEEAERANKVLDIKVFATDMAERSLQNARAGLYPGGIEAEIEPERLDRFFQKEDAMYRVRATLRECVVFAPQNVLQDPPFSRLDIISCRNLLIYLEPPIQLRILALLHFGLREGGTLFLGTSETASGSDGLFEPIDKKARIYRRVGPTRHGAVEFPLPHPGNGGSRKSRVRRENYAPCCRALNEPDDQPRPVGTPHAGGGDDQPRVPDRLTITGTPSHFWPCRAASRRATCCNWPAKAFAGRCDRRCIGPLRKRHGHRPRRLA